MYQLEVKHHLVRELFPPSDGWEVVVDVDAMERAKGPQHKPDKKQKVHAAEECLRSLGAKLGSHEIYGRVDVYAHHDVKGTYLVEVEGESSRQKEQAMYSAIGQTILMMESGLSQITYGLAVPDEPSWEKQILKIPNRIKAILHLNCYMVSQDGVRKI